MKVNSARISTLVLILCLVASLTVARPIEVWRRYRASYKTRGHRTLTRVSSWRPVVPVHFHRRYHVGQHRINPSDLPDFVTTTPSLSSSTLTLASTTANKQTDAPLAATTLTPKSPEVSTTISKFHPSDEKSIALTVATSTKSTFILDDTTEPASTAATITEDAIPEETSARIDTGYQGLNESDPNFSESTEPNSIATSSTEPPSTVPTTSEAVKPEDSSTITAPHYALAESATTVTSSVEPSSSANTIDDAPTAFMTSTTAAPTEASTSEPVRTETVSPEGPIMGSTEKMVALSADAQSMTTPDSLSSTLFYEENMEPEIEQ